MKKLLFVTMAIVLSVSLFAAGTSEDGGSADVEITPPGSFPIVENSIELSYMIPREERVSDYEDNTLTQFLEDRTNVTMDLRLVSGQDYKDRMNLMFAAQADLPDMIHLQNTDVNGQLLWGVQGVLLPLNDLIEEQGTLIKEVFRQRPEVENLMRAADGNIYSLANISSCPHCDPSNRFWINQEWLDAVGMDAPETTEEFRAVLRAFRDEDPNGNGEADEIPLIGARTGWQMSPIVFLLNSFTDWDNIEKMYVEDDEIVPAFTTEAFRDGLRYMNSLVEEGLLDPVSFTQDQNQLRTLLASSPTVIGVFPAGGAFFENNPASANKYVHLDPLEGPDGVRNAAYNPWTGVGQGQGSITTEAAYPEIAFRWFEQFYDPDVSIIARFGVEGRDWRPTEPGEIALNSAKEQVPAVMLENVWAVQQPHNIHWYLMHPSYMPVSIETADWDAFDPIAKMGDSTLQLLEYVPPVETQVPPLAYLPDEIEEYQELWSTIDTYVNESIIRFIVGDLNIESDWDEFVSEAERAGLGRFVEIKQAAYDRVWR